MSDPIDPNKRHDPAEDEVQVAKEVKQVLIGCALAALSLFLLAMAILFFMKR